MDQYSTALYACKYIIHHTVFTVQACYSENSVSSTACKEFEDKAYDIIKNATDADIVDAIDYCVEAYGVRYDEVTADDVLKVIGDTADTPYETLMVDYINVIKEL